MAISERAKAVITRPLPQEKIKQRPGNKGMTFDYVTPDFVISLLNEAFEYGWDTRILSHEMYGETALVVLELAVSNEDGSRFVTKQQFGSCDVGRGMGHGDAFKGAASDALKKAATLLGVALELYQDDVAPPEPNFRKPVTPPRPPTAESVPRPGPSAKKPAPPAPPAAPPSTPPKPAVPAAVPKPVASPRGSFDPKPSAVAKPSPPRSVSVPAGPIVNPFAKENNAAGPTSTQISALTNLAQRKEFSQSEAIALANVVDDMGNPKQVFEELTHAEAIEVVKACQF